MPKKIKPAKPESFFHSTDLSLVNAEILRELCQMIEDGRSQVAQAVNASLTLLYWQIGKCVHLEILKGERAAYGNEIVSVVGQNLSQEYGRGFLDKSLWHMIRFSEAFPDLKKVSALRRELTCTHIKRLIYIDAPLKRLFYAEMCRMERWITRTLEKKLDSMFYLHIHRIGRGNRFTARILKTANFRPLTIKYR